MRRLIWICASVALLWCGWWWLASSALHQGVTSWLAERRAEGWQADVNALEGGGFPMHLQAGLRELALADPETGVALQMSSLDISALAWWPGDVTVALDPGPVQLSTPQGKSQLQMTDSVMAMELRPGTALALEKLGWTSGPWQLTDAAGLRAKADSLTLTKVQSDGPTYTYRASAERFAPGAPARRGLQLPDAFPDAFDSLQVTATVTYDRIWDRRALSERRPQPRRIIIPLAEARWGDLSLNLATDLTIDANGAPEGRLSLQAENWQTMLDIAEAAGLLPPGLRPQAETILAAMARANGNETTLDVDLNLRDGAIFLGFIPIAPTPDLRIR